MNQLQEVVEVLGSAIINYADNMISIVGFYSIDRMTDWENGKDCWQSKYLFDDRGVVIDYTRIQDNALFIVKREGQELERHCFEPFFKGVAKFKNIAEKKQLSRTFTLRKSMYSQQYHIVYQENKERQCIVCASMEGVADKLDTLFPQYKLDDLDKNRIDFQRVMQMASEKYSSGLFKL